MKEMKCPTKIGSVMCLIIFDGIVNLMNSRFHARKTVCSANNYGRHESLWPLAFSMETVEKLWKKWKVIIINRFWKCVVCATATTKVVT